MATKEDTALVKIGVDCCVCVGELVRVAVVGGDAERVDLGVGLVVEALREHGDHEDVDEEADEEGDGRLDEEVHVCLLHLALLGSVNISRFDQGTEQKETYQTFYSYPEQMATCAGKDYGA